MANDRLDKVKERLSAYYDAELAILGGQSYTIGSMTLSRANLMHVRQQIKELELLRDQLEYKEKYGSRRRTIRVTPRDL